MRRELIRSGLPPEQALTMMQASNISPEILAYRLGIQRETAYRMPRLGVRTEDLEAFLDACQRPAQDGEREAARALFRRSKRWGGY